MRAFMVQMLQKAFPDLEGWRWSHEVQRAHRAPFNIRQPVHPDAKPRAILVYFGNFLLRQLIFEKARPDAQRAVDRFSFFTRPDFCHTTVERRWRLRQMISQFQEKGAQAFLLNPARLKIIWKDRVRVFTSEIKAKEFLDAGCKLIMMGLVGRGQVVDKG